MKLRKNQLSLTKIFVLVLFVGIQVVTSDIFYQQSFDDSRAIIQKTKLLQTADRSAYGLAVYITYVSSNGSTIYQLSLTMFKNKQTNKLYVYETSSNFIWEASPSFYDQDSINIFYTLGANSDTWVIYSFKADGSSNQIDKQSQMSIIPSGFFPFKSGYFIIAQKGRIIYIERESNSPQKIQNFISISNPTFANGDIAGSDSLYFIGISDSQPLIYYTISSNGGYTVKKISQSQGILRINQVFKLPDGTIQVEEDLHGYTKVYTWNISDPEGTFQTFRVQGSYYSFLLMKASAGLLFVSDNDPLPTFHKTDANQYIIWNGQNPLNSGNNWIKTDSRISTLYRLLAPATSYLVTHDESFIIVYCDSTDSAVRVTELKFKGDLNNPENVIFDTFKTPDEFPQDSSRRILVNDSSPPNPTSNVQTQTFSTTGAIKQLVIDESNYPFQLVINFSLSFEGPANLFVLPTTFSGSFTCQSLNSMTESFSEGDYSGFKPLIIANTSNFSFTFQNAPPNIPLNILACKIGLNLQNNIVIKYTPSFETSLTPKKLTYTLKQPIQQQQYREYLCNVLEDIDSYPTEVSVFSRGTFCYIEANHLIGDSPPPSTSIKEVNIIVTTKPTNANSSAVDDTINKILSNMDSSTIIDFPVAVSFDSVGNFNPSFTGLLTNNHDNVTFNGTYSGGSGYLYVLIDNSGVVGQTYTINQVLQKYTKSIYFQDGVMFSFTIPYAYKTNYLSVVYVTGDEYAQWYSLTGSLNTNIFQSNSSNSVTIKNSAVYIPDTRTTTPNRGSKVPWIMVIALVGAAVSIILMCVCLDITLRRIHRRRRARELAIQNAMERLKPNMEVAPKEAPTTIENCASQDINSLNALVSSRADIPSLTHLMEDNQQQQEQAHQEDQSSLDADIEAGVAVSYVSQASQISEESHKSAIHQPEQQNNAENPNPQSVSNENRLPSNTVVRTQNRLPSTIIESNSEQEHSMVAVNPSAENHINNKHELQTISLESLNVSYRTD